MTATAYAAEELLAVELQAESEHVQHAEPNGEAPYERYSQPEVDVFAVPLLGLRRHSVTVLSTLVAVQVVWIAALAYGLYRFVV